MITIEANGKVKISFDVYGEGEGLLRIQKALLLAIEDIGSHRHHSGDQDHQDAINVLTDLLRNCMLDMSQTNVGLGGKPYGSEMKKSG